MPPLTAPAPGSDPRDAPPPGGRPLRGARAPEGNPSTALARSVTATVPARRARDGRARGAGGPPGKRWQPPEGLTPEEVKAVIAAARTDRDRLLLRALWATGGRVSEVLALRGQDVRRDSLVLPNRKNPGRPTKRVFLA